MPRWSSPSSRLSRGRSRPVPEASGHTSRPDAVPPRRITLLTDFGSADGYAAALRGVLASLAPYAAVDDASHDIAPGDVHAAAAALDRYWHIYPPGTVHVVVVDPGVGSARRALVVQAAERFGVGPDNGVLEPLLSATSSVRIHSAANAALHLPEVSATFHGRDVFAPLAAHLAGGGSLDAVGPPVTDAVRLAVPPPHQTADTVRGAVVHIDRFGNLVTNVTAERTTDAVTVRVQGRDVGPLRRTYADVAPGDVLALIGSSGRLEISVRDGHAARALGVARGAEVIVERSRARARSAG